MTYVANHRVDAGKDESGEPRIFAPGSEVPAEFVDEAMIEAGSVSEGKADAGPYAGLTRKELFALCEAREIDAPDRAKVAELKALLLAADAGSEDDGGD